MSIRKNIENKLRKILSPIIGSEEVEEIYLSIGHSMGPKPGGGRKFPESNPEGGDSLNLSVDDGPHQFPEEEDF